MALFGYHEKDEDVAVADYGTPIYTLYTEDKLVSIHQEVNVFDDKDQLRYTGRSKPISFTNATTITDGKGNLVSSFKSKILTIRATHIIEMANGTSFSIKNQLFHVVREVLDIEELGWQIQGNILQCHYVIIDENNKIIASIGQKLLSIHNKFSIDIYDDSVVDEIITIVITLQHMIRNSKDAETDFDD